MLATHLNAIEQRLIAQAKVQDHAGHSLHKGTPREAFIREFLETHLASTVAIGTGEVIDANSKPGQRRNQLDVVVYRREYPKLDFGGDVTCFLSESVVATIEVKSTLDKGSIHQAVAAARRLKLAPRHASSIMQIGAPATVPKCLIVAFDGPSSMNTVHSWIEHAHRDEGVGIPRLPLTGMERLGVPSPGLDGVFVLGKGFVHFDNLQFGYIPDEFRAEHPEAKWVFHSCEEHNLLVLFLLLASTMGNLPLEVFNPASYAIGTQLHDLSMGT